jgi:DNA-binding NtrC family response regulator
VTNRQNVVLLIGTEAPGALRAAFERAGFRVTTAQGALGAIAQIAPRTVASIVLDGDGTHGVAVITYLRHRYPHAPLLYLCPAGADVAERASRMRGTTIALRKPVAPGLVVDTVADALCAGEHLSDRGAWRCR